MKNWKMVSLPAVLVGLLGLLAACGGDTPTVTAVPTTVPATNTVMAAPTNTVMAAPTNTVMAAPTNTVMAAPTDTVMAAPTNTVMAAPTDSGMAAATATGAMPAAGGTGTPGAAMTTPDTSSMGTPGAAMMTPGAGGMSGGMAATSSDLQLITDAYTATQSLKSYHFTLAANGDVVTQPVSIEGDFVAPDKAYIKGTFSGTRGEQLRIGNKAYKKDASGKWVPDAANSTTGSPTDVTASANIVSGLGTFLQAGSNYRDTQQDETMDGVTVKHFVGQVDATKLASGAAGLGTVPPLGSVALWIDPQTKYIHKAQMAIDLSSFMKMMTGMVEALQGTPTPGGATATPIGTMKFNIDMTLSKLNDTSITVPTP